MCLQSCAAANTDQVLLEVFKYLDYENLAKASCICRKWNEIACDDSLWRPLCKRQWALNGLPDACVSWKEYFVYYYERFGECIDDYQSCKRNWNSFTESLREQCPRLDNQRLKLIKTVQNANCPLSTNPLLQCEAKQLASSGKARNPMTEAG